MYTNLIFELLDSLIPNNILGICFHHNHVRYMYMLTVSLFIIYAIEAISNLIME